jgi:hypothetical protein
MDYTAPGTETWKINPQQLRHRYFVQLGPDGYPVVGMLQQGTRPPVGEWLEIGTIRQQLPERYFVQQTNFNTLVPGSLVQTDTPPGNTWKDIRIYDRFHRFQFWWSYDAFPSSSEHILVSIQDFIVGVVTPALDEVYPNRDLGKPIAFKLYYFENSYEQLVNDPTKLVPFSSESVLAYKLTDSGTYADSFDTLTSTPANLTIKPEAPDDFYSIVLKVVNGSDSKSPIDYLFIENIVHKFLPG